MRAAALLLLAGSLAGPAVPGRAAAPESAAVWDAVVELYRPGGPLNARLDADIAGKDAPDFLAKLLSDPGLTPMGPEAGARWFRERLKVVRGPKQVKREGLVGMVLEKSAVLEWKSVPTGVR